MSIVRDDKKGGQPPGGPPAVEFDTVVDNIARKASGGGLTEQGLVEVLQSTFGPQGVSVNCYPGVAHDACRDTAYFVALHGAMSKGTWPYDFASLLEELVRHMQGRCQETQYAVVVSDAWWPEPFEKLRAEIQKICLENKQVIFYLIFSSGHKLRFDICDFSMPLLDYFTE